MKTGDIVVLVQSLVRSKIAAAEPRRSTCQGEVDDTLFVWVKSTMCSVVDLYKEVDSESLCNAS